MNINKRVNRLTILLFARFLKWFINDTEEIYRSANIAGALEPEDKTLMKEFRMKVRDFIEWAEKG